jgi:predicted transport protein
MAKFNDHVRYASPSIQPLIVELDQRIRKLAKHIDPILQEVTDAERIAYRLTGKQQFLEMKVQKEKVLVRFRRTIVRDDKNLLRDIPKKHLWPWEQELDIQDGCTLNYAMRFIEAAYEKSLASKN